jgi:hypothetical protein
MLNKNEEKLASVLIYFYEVDIDITLIERAVSLE